MILDQKDTNTIIQILCSIRLQTKAQKLFINASMPQVDTADLKQRITDLQLDLADFARQICTIEQNHIKKEHEK